MSQAYKCDRCGMLYEENIITNENRRIYSVTKQSKLGESAAVNYFDLCSQCQSALEDFLLEKTFSPNEVEKLIVIHGQNDRNFKLGEQIKYSPSEIRKILKGEKKNE